MIVLGCVAVREGVVSVVIEDPLMVQSVILGVGFGGVLALFGTPVTGVGLVDGRDLGLVLRVLELAGGALPEKVVVQLGISCGVEGEVVDLAFFFYGGQ